MKLRLATEADAELISGIAHRIWREHYPAVIGEEQVEYMLNLSYTPEALVRQMSEGQVFYLPEWQGSPLGYLSISQKAPGQYFLHKFYIDNGQRGKGMGKVVLERVLAQFPDLKELRLTVNRQNYKSINFYFRVGFVIEHCLDIPIGGGYVMNDFQMVFRTL